MVYSGNWFRVSEKGGCRVRETGELCDRLSVKRVRKLGNKQNAGEWRLEYYETCINEVQYSQSMQEKVTEISENVMSKFACCIWTDEKRDWCDEGMNG